jgi:hypothetical protein
VLKRFTFDRMYTPKASQKEIYQDVKPLTMSVLDGYNCCVFAYGQTGTGKTHTMQGPASDPGVTYRAVKDLFETAERAVMHGYTFAFRISVLEIYNERIFDLLVDPRTAQVCCQQSPICRQKSHVCRKRAQYAAKRAMSATKEPSMPPKEPW